MSVAPRSVTSCQVTNGVLCVHCDSPEKYNQLDVCIAMSMSMSTSTYTKQCHNKELGHGIMEAEKSHDVCHKEKIQRRQ